MFYGSRLFLVFFLMMQSGCTSLFFYPMQEYVRTPDRVGVKYEDVILHTSDNVTLHSWLLRQEGERKGTVLFLHGNAENISTHIRSVYWLAAKGYEVFLLDYRGFGMSEGKTKIPAVFKDVDAAAIYLHDRDNVILLGQSIGGAIGYYWLATSPHRSLIKKAVFDSTFGSYRAMVDEVLERSWITWLFQKPAAYSYSTRYDPLTVGSQLPAIPKLMIHSPKDQIVPYRFGYELYQHTPQPVTFLETDLLHIETFESMANRQYLLDFIQQ